VNASADFGEDDVILSQISGSMNAVEANRLVNEEQGELFVVLVREGTDASVPKRQVRIASNDDRIHQLYEQYKDDLFTDELPPGLPVSRGEFDHKIKLIDDRKTSVGYTVRLSTLEQDQLKVMIDDMLKKGFLSPSSSPFGAPCFFVKKPHDQGLRLVVDWRNLNANTVKDKNQLPNIIDFLSLLHRARYFSILDGHSGFWQVLLCPEDRDKTAF